MSAVGRCWKQSFSPLRYWGAVAASDVQSALRGAFTRWGLPSGLRVDNGQPWGSSAELPTALALWVIGLGVSMHWNRPYHAQANAKVERSHGVAAQWAEPARCADAQALQAHLQWAKTIQREHYPACDGRSRRQAYPELAHSGRSYTSEQEVSLWDATRVYRLLAQGQWLRRVGSGGQISIYDWSLWVGSRYRGQTVFVRFDPDQVAWRISDHNGQLLACPPAPYLSRENMLALQISRRPNRR
jgi:Integrase core domain.